MSKGTRKTTDAVLVEGMEALKAVIRVVPPRDSQDIVRYVVPEHHQHVLDVLVQRFAACFTQLTKEVGTEFVATMMRTVVGRLEGEPTAETLDEFLRELEKFPVEVRKLGRVVRGASIERGTSCTLGPVMFLQLPEEASQLKAVPYLPDLDLYRALQLNREDRCVFAMIQVAGYRIADAADAVGDERLEQLESMLRYMLRNEDGYDLGIFEFREPHLRRVVSLSPTWNTMGVEPRGTVSLVPIDHPLFVDETLGHARLWALLSADAPGEMERRILTAVEWVGRGLYDKNHTKGFVQFMFAYEALFNYDDDGKTRFSPALSHGMAEIAAFVLSSGREERKAAWKRLKELYGLRCGIAHGGGTTATRGDYDEAREIVSRLITRLLVDADLSKLPNLHSLRDWVTDKRFS